MTITQLDSDLKTLPKDSLVSQAEKIIDDGTFHVSGYDQVAVWTIRDAVWVTFDQFIQFVPPTGKHYYSVDVNLSQPSWSSMPYGVGALGKEKFFYPSTQQKQQIDYVLKILGNSVITPTQLERIKKEGTITINESENQYDVTISDKTSIISLKIRKKTSEIFSKAVTDYTPMRDSYKVRIY